MDELKKQELHNDLMVYGFIIKDKSFTTVSGDHRVRIIKMCDVLFYDYMWNGEVIDCEELK